MKCKKLARVEYDYTAQDEQELSVLCGGILLILEDIDTDWWPAQEHSTTPFFDAKRGLVPASYLTEMRELYIATVLYDYDGKGEQISIREGDKVKVYEIVDDDWSFGMVGDEVGLVPASYLQVIDIIREEERSDGGNLDAETQKSMLLNALGGLGFERKKSDVKVTGIIYGPDDGSYYPVTETSQKKKLKCHLCISQIDKRVYLVHDVKVVHQITVDQGDNQLICNN